MACLVASGRLRKQYGRCHLGAVYLVALAGHIRAASASPAALVALSSIIRVLEGGESSAVLAYDTVTNFALIAATVSLAAMQRAQRAAVRPEVQLVAVRILQEAITNVLKHAAAHRVCIHLSRQADDLVVRVQDDGHPDGFEAGGGIRGMHERARELGGTLQVDSGSQGFIVEARLPAGSAL